MKIKSKNYFAYTDFFTKIKPLLTHVRKTPPLRWKYYFKHTLASICTYKVGPMLSQIFMIPQFFHRTGRCPYSSQLWMVQKTQRSSLQTNPNNVQFSSFLDFKRWDNLRRYSQFGIWSHNQKKGDNL